MVDEGLQDGAAELALDLADDGTVGVDQVGDG